MSTENIQTEDSETNVIRAKIFGKNYVHIERTESSIPWSQEVHAVNWFNTRSMPLYRFYTLIASRSVRSVGGVPVFKGSLIKSLHGSERDIRTVLLLVKYPSPLNFRTMAEDAYFKTVSLFRALAVKDFTFCLTHAVTTFQFESKNKDDWSYVIHHFRGDNRAIDLAREVCRKTSVELIFASVKTHRVMSVNAKNTVTPIPDIMDGILLYRATDPAVLESVMLSEAYQPVIELTDTSFIGLLARLM